MAINTGFQWTFTKPLEGHNFANNNSLLLQKHQIECQEKRSSEAKQQAEPSDTPAGKKNVKDTDRFVHNGSAISTDELSATHLEVQSAIQHQEWFTRNKINP